MSLSPPNHGVSAVKPYWRGELIFFGSVGAVLAAITPYALLDHSGFYFNPGEARLLEFVVICIVLPGMTVPLALAVRRALRYPHPTGCVCWVAAINLFVLLIGSTILYGIAVI
jgi:hypothetical protein